MPYNRAKSFVTIMIVIASVALLLRIGVERLIKMNIASNETGASLTLKLISTALENYAKNNEGAYPTNFTDLTGQNPAYIDRDYLAQSSIKGYTYSCFRLDSSGYSCQASPTRCNLTGKMIYTVSTGNLFVSEDCSKKE